jgi:hypothetical protein
MSNVNTHVNYSLKLLFAAVFALLLAACAALNPGPRAYTVSQTQLLALISQRFPFNGRVAELLDVQVLAPRLKLLPESNRIATELDIRLSESLLRSAFQGSLAMDYGLRFEPSDNSIRLADVKVSRLQFAGVPERFAPWLNSLGPFLAERLLNDLSLHQISAKDLSPVAGWAYVPGEFKVTAEGLAISLLPRKTP